MNRSINGWVWFAIGALLLLIMSVASVSLGAVSIPVTSVLSWLAGLPAEGLTESQKTILWELRVPRVLAALLVGGGLACAGVGFQGLFRNVLADPYIIGASSGASLGVALAIVLNWQGGFLGLGTTAIAATIGSISVVSIVFLIGLVGRQASALTLLLSGVAISSFASALVSLSMFLNDQKAIVILSWIMGSIAGCDWPTLILSGTMGSLGIIIIWCHARPLDAYLLGDVTSHSLGLHLLSFRIWLIVGASLATAAAVSMAGVVGFVGLIAPQIARLIVGPKHGILIPMSLCMGATIMLVADAASRTLVESTELPVGIVTAMLGCPFFLVLVLRRSSQRGSP